MAKRGFVLRSNCKAPVLAPDRAASTSPVASWEIVLTGVLSQNYQPLETWTPRRALLGIGFERHLSYACCVLVRAHTHNVHTRVHTHVCRHVYMCTPIPLEQKYHETVPMVFTCKALDFLFASSLV